MTCERKDLINNVGFDYEDMKLIRDCIDISPQYSNVTKVLNFGKDIDKAVVEYIYKNLKKNVKYINEKCILRIKKNDNNLLAALDENIAYTITEAAQGRGNLEKTVCAIVTEPYFYEDDEYVEILSRYESEIEKYGGEVIFLVKGLSKKQIHMIKLERNLNTVTIDIDYKKFISGKFYEDFLYKPGESMVNVIANAVKNVTSLSLSTIKREIEYLHDICAITDQCIPSEDFAESVLMVEGERCYKERFDDLIGLDETKREILSIVKSYIISKRLSVEKTITGLRIALSGKPGTGKSTLAELIVAMLRQEGVLDDGSAYEIISARELIGTAIGHSEEKIRKIVAENDLIVLDEIGALCPNSDGRADSFTDAVNKMLVYYMEAESTRGKHFILAGYPDEIKSYISSDVGLSSRIKNIIHLEDYTSKELVSIAKQCLHNEHLKFDDTEQIDKELSDFVDGLSAEYRNAREMRNLAVYTRDNVFTKYFDENLSLGNGVKISGEDVKIGVDTFVKKNNLSKNISRPIGFVRNNENLTAIN